MKISIEIPGYEEFLKDRTLTYINNRERSLYDEAYENGEKHKEEEIYKFLRKAGFETDCKHGRPKWSCKECLK